MSKLKIHRPPWWTAWLLAWVRLFDGLIGVLGLAMIPLDMEGSFAAWTWQKYMTERTDSDPRRNRKRDRRKRWKRRQRKKVHSR